jgi:hypothetical protein
MTLRGWPLVVPWLFASSRFMFRRAGLEPATNPGVTCNGVGEGVDPLERPGFAPEWDGDAATVGDG